MFDIDWYELISSERIRTIGVPLITTFLMIVVKAISNQFPNENGFVNKLFHRNNFNFGLQLTVTSFALYFIGQLKRLKGIIELDLDSKTLFNDVTGTFGNIGFFLLAIVSLSVIVRHFGWIHEGENSKPSIFIGVICPITIGIYSLSVVVNSITL